MDGSNFVDDRLLNYPINRWLSSETNFHTLDLYLGAKSLSACITDENTSRAISLTLKNPNETFNLNYRLGQVAEL